MRTGMTAVLAVVAGLTVGASGVFGAPQQGAPSVQRGITKPHADADAMIAKAIAYLRAAQDSKTGGWCIQEGAPVFPAITGLVLQGMLAQPGVTDADPAVQAGVKFMLDSQQKDGGIYVGLLPSYNTAICLSALSKVSSPPRVAEARDRALAFLRTIQYGEAAVAHEGLGESAQAVGRGDSFYGGFGYGRHGRPDLSNTSFAVEAMHSMNLPENDPAYERVLVFLQRCQMQQKAGTVDVNDMSYAAGSTQGGFIYSTSVNRDKVATGQSPAGEVLEDLSGGPGLAASIRLKQKGADGKPVLLTREQIAARIKDREDKDAHREVAGLGTRYTIAFGPTADGASANSFDLSADIQAEGAFTTMLHSAFADVLDDAKDVRVRSVDHWNGVPRHRAYGTMTYAGLKSYLYAGLAKNDPRVLAARDWIARNYTLEVNPGSLETDGLYYYYVMFARTYDALGEARVPVRTAAGVTEQHDWASDLIGQLATLQNEDGSFRSVDDRWMENNPVLITAYSLIALQCAAR